MKIIIAICANCCRSRYVNRHLLCRSCYCNESVRDSYVKRETLLSYPGKPLPIEATTAMPGSEEKIAVLAARYQAGVALWHPLDRVSRGPRGVRRLLFERRLA